ncbi:condensation domain-containing protein [Streptomyces sp. NK08204]|uniref:condensation domain-containing protein n=1 Tax=Streptomyces sp. NK08204 TaxID=2873260 RepID=UPI001CEDF28A|nr:condensation domain-containing protein [Streptomyces sp. NK08204]
MPETAEISDTQASILGFLTAARGDGEGDPYVLARVLELRGPVDPARFAAAARALAARHEALRTVFEPGADGWVQRVLAPGAVDVQHIRVADGDRTAALTLIAEERARGFDVRREAQVRVRLYETGAERYVALFLFHHLTCDGWSMALALRDFGALYAGRALPEPGRFRDFAAWQRERSRGASWERHLDYWAGRLKDFRPQGALVDAAATTGDHRAGKAWLEVPEGLQHSVVSAAAKVRVSPYVAHAAAWALGIADVLGEQSFLLASPVALRHAPGCEDMVGDLTNMLLCPLRVTPGMTERELLGTLHPEHYAALGRLDVHYQRVLRALELPTAYHVRIGYHAQPRAELAVPGLEARTLRIPGELTSRRLVALELDASTARPAGAVVHRRALLPDRDAEELAAAYLRRLERCGGALEDWGRKS